MFASTPQFARRLWLTVFVVGLVAVLAAGNATIDTPGLAPTQRNWVIGQLDHSHSFGQTFTADQSSLAAIRVLLFVSPTDGGKSDPITLRVRYAGAASPDLVVATLPLHALSRQGMTTFAFPPLRTRTLPHVITTTLAFTIEAPTIAPEDGISVIAGPDTYPGGSLLLNDKPERFADLAFQPVYRQYWFNTWFPIARIADGKSGVFGWSPLYVVLAYVYGWLLIVVLVKLWQRVRVFDSP